ncbi:hypothetical protein COU37_01385 [Candidatus Micrarchaeota archaeon CG10_big_fil_rev_8_21_14_0_10_45_29]|nr:MAG: hypothetical protein COU37_01385 [Candidatus Micrarchaeota archaeon CG10_big_fil_rev_8_21_14_0_10_45_29]
MVQMHEARISGNYEEATQIREQLHESAGFAGKGMMHGKGMFSRGGENETPMGAKGFAKGGFGCPMLEEN